MNNLFSGKNAEDVGKDKRVTGRTDEEYIEKKSEKASIFTYNTEQKFLVAI